MLFVYFILIHQFFGDDILKKFLKTTSLLMTLSLSLLLTGCGKNNEQENNPIQKERNYDIFVYNSDGNIGESFRKMCDDYTSRSGVTIRTVTPSDEENTFDNLQNYLSGNNPPTVFSVSSIYELNKLKENSQIWDFNNATEDSFKEIVNSIPEELKLSSNTVDSFGIPYTIEGYGFLVDQKMISSLFGGNQYRKALYDLKNCSYDEFYEFVKAVSNYISNGSTYEFTLNDNTYSLVPEKGELSKNLNGIFSFPAGTSKYITNYIINPSLASVFGSAAEANIADDSKMENLSYALMNFSESLDFITSNISIINGATGRGLDILSTTKNSTSQAMKNFVNGKSLFLLANSNDYNNISVFNSLISKRCTFIQIKIPLNNIMENSDATEKKINRGITVYAPRYYCINANASDDELKKAQDFLTWIHTSDLAQKYVISNFGFAPYDVEHISVIDNPLSRAVLEYVNDKKILPAVYRGTPNSWCENIGKYLSEKYLSKSDWSNETYKEIADYGVDKWKEFAN